MFKKFILILFINVFVVKAQVVYEPIDNSIYSFLDEISNKGLININLLIKPIPRIEIAKQLLKLKNKQNDLTEIELKELNFYCQDFQDEITFLQNNSFDTTETHKFAYYNSDISNLYRYTSELLTLKADVIYGVSLENRFGKKFTHRWNGASVYGYLDNNIGYMFNFRDNREESDYLDHRKILSDEMGITANPLNGGLEYSEARASLSYNWSWGTITFAKDYITWGYEKSGNIVLGRKAPTYPYVRLDIKPTDWFSFNYIHAFLESQIIDSIETYKIHSYRESSRIIYRSKYLASHTISIRYKNITFNAGESMVYSDQIRPLYLLPVMFFRLADHYYSNINNDAGDNAQFFFNISSRNDLPNTHLYATLYIDEITLSNLFDKQKQRYQVAMNYGISNYGGIINNLSLTLEYTKIFPFVYQHYIKTIDYSSSNYSLGHWLSDNADLFYFSTKYKFFRGLDLQTYFKYIRKGNGGLSDSLMRYRQYTNSIPQPKFLWGKVAERLYLGAELTYEIWHNFVVKLAFEYTNFKDELKDNSRTFDYQLGKNNNYKFSIYYKL